MHRTSSVMLAFPLPRPSVGFSICPHPVFTHVQYTRPESGYFHPQVVRVRSRPPQLYFAIYLLRLSRTESVCRYFPPLPQPYFALYIQSLSRTDTRRVRWTRSCLGNPFPSDPMESVCRHFPPPPQLYFAALYLLSLSRIDLR